MKKRSYLKHIASALAACLAVSISASIFSLSASATLTITPTKYIGYVNYNYANKPSNLYYSSYVNAAESYDSRHVSYDGIITGPWASSTATATVVSNTGTVWETVLPFASFYKNSSSMNFTNIYRMKYSLSTTVLGVSNILQDPIVILSKVNGSQLTISDFNDYFICGVVAIGDANCNGVIDNNDLTALSQLINNTYTNPTDANYIAADVDLDGDIDINDYDKLDDVLNGLDVFW